VPHKALFAVDAHRVLPAEHGTRDRDLTLVAFALRGLALLATLDRPAHVAVDLGAPRRLPLGWRTAALNRVLLGLAQSRPARPDHRRVDDLITHRQPTPGQQRRVKPRKQPLASGS